jgi:hypothetical protein
MGNDRESAMRIFGLFFVFLSAFLSFAHAQTPPSDPGTYLLRVVKELVESGRVDDSARVAVILNMKLTRTNLSLSTPDACPAGTYQFEADYVVTGNGWFHSLPTGMKSTPTAGIAVGRPFPRYYSIVSKPGLTYKIQSNDFDKQNCVGLDFGKVGANMEFDNIPSYACISAAQLVSVFPKIVYIDRDFPDRPGTFQYLATGQYSSEIALHYVDKNRPFEGPSTDQLELDTDVPHAYVDFIMPSAGPDHRPPCLLSMYISAEYNYGALHRPDVGKISLPPVEVRCLNAPTPLDGAFCEGEMNFSVKSNLDTIFNQSQTGLTLSQQMAAKQKQAAWSQQLDRACTVETEGAVFTDFKCATTTMIQRTVALSQGLTAPVSGLIGRASYIYWQGDDCTPEPSRIALAACQLGNATAAAEDYRTIHDDYLAHIDSSQKPQFLADQKVWHRSLDRSCVKNIDGATFVDFGCVENEVQARAYFFAAQMSRPATAYNGQYIVPASAMPRFPLGGWNDNGTFFYNIPNGTGPTVLTLARLQARPGQKLTVKYISGTITDSAGKPLTDQAGSWNDPESVGNGAFTRRTGSSMPALVGAFTDAKGNIIPVPNGGDIIFGIGVGGTTQTIPPGATQLQLGINESRFDQSKGSLTASVAVSDAN